MKSFLSVDHKEGRWVRCELENIPNVDSIPEKYGEVECFYVSIPLSMFFDKQFPIKQGDIYVVEHNGYDVTEILELDDEEKKRRIEWLSSFK